MGIQISSHETQLVTERLIREGAVGKIREVHTFCDKAWGDTNPIPAGADPVPATLDWDGWIGVSEPRPFKTTVYHPGNWRQAHRLRHRHARRHGLPHLQHAAARPGPDPAAAGHVARAGARHGSWPMQSKIHFVFRGTPYTAGDTLDFWWYDGAERPPQAVIDAVGGKLPSSGRGDDRHRGRDPAARTSTTRRCTRRRSSSTGRSRRARRGITTTSSSTRC